MLESSLEGQEQVLDEVEEQTQKWEGQHDSVEVVVELQHPRNRVQKGNYDCIQQGLEGMGQQKEGKYSGRDSCWNCNPASGKTENY
jgi:hypothetical protein